MSDISNESLQKIAKGTSISFIGSLLTLIFNFVGQKVLIARFWTEAEFGVFSLAFVILNITVLIATLGLWQGSARNIAYARSKEDDKKVQEYIKASIQFGVLTSVILSIIIYSTSGIIADRVFHDSSLALPLKIIAFGIPFSTLIRIFDSIFRGYDEVKPGVYIGKILRTFIFFILLLAVIFLNLAFNNVFYVLLISSGLSFILFTVYAIKRLPLSIVNLISFRGSAGKELLYFSVPLLGVTILQQLMDQTDTVMLGFFKTSAEVGLYSSAYPLSTFVQAPLLMMVSIYIPITSGLYAQNSLSKIRSNYSVLTRWLCSLTLPLFLIFFLFPETVLSFLFGANYTAAANVLRILSLGVIFSNFMGPNGATLIAMGRSQFVMWATLTATVINVGLNATLIPPYGIFGAAIASTLSIISINLIRGWKVYSISRAQPFSWNLLKPTLLSLTIILLMYFVFTCFITVSWWMLPLLFILYYTIYGLATLVTKSFDQEDVAMLQAVEKKAGVNITPIKKILRRFL